jgi:hypothetical protein
MQRSPNGKEEKEKKSYLKIIMTIIDGVCGTMSVMRKSSILGQV